MDRIRSVGNLGGGNTQSRTVYIPKGLCPTLCSGMDHGNTIPYVVIEDGSEADRKHNADKEQK